MPSAEAIALSRQALGLMLPFAIGGTGRQERHGIGLLDTGSIFTWVHDASGNAASLRRASGCSASEPWSTVFLDGTVMRGAACTAPSLRIGNLRARRQPFGLAADNCSALPPLDVARTAGAHQLVGILGFAPARGSLHRVLTADALSLCRTPPTKGAHRRWTLRAGALCPAPPPPGTRVAVPVESSTQQQWKVAIQGLRIDVRSTAAFTSPPVVVNGEHSLNDTATSCAQWHGPLWQQIRYIYAPAEQLVAHVDTGSTHVVAPRDAAMATIGLHALASEVNLLFDVRTGERTHARSITIPLVRGRWQCGRAQRHSAAPAPTARRCMGRGAATWRGRLDGLAAVLALEPADRAPRHRPERGASREWVLGMPFIDQLQGLGLVQHAGGARDASDGAVSITSSGAGKVLERRRSLSSLPRQADDVGAVNSHSGIIILDLL